MLPTAYADHAYLLEHAGAPACLQSKLMEKTHARYASLELRNCWSEMRALYMHKKLCLWKMQLDSSHSGGLSCCPQHMRTVCIYRPRQFVYSGSAHGKAHPNYVRLSTSDCATAGERQARCASPHDVCLPKLQYTVPSHGAKPVVLPNPSTRTMRIYWCTSRPAVEAHVTSEISSSSDCETAGERHLNQTAATGGGLSWCPQHMRTERVQWCASPSTVAAHTAKLILIMCICQLQIVQLLMRDRYIVHLRKYSHVPHIYGLCTSPSTSMSSTNECQDSSELHAARLS